MLLIVSGLFLTLCMLTGCGAPKDKAITSLEQLNDASRKIGVSSDTAEDRVVMQELPEAQIEYYKDDIAAYTSVSQGKLDAFVFNKPAMESALYFGLKDVHLLDETLGEGNTSGVAFSPVTKIPDLENRVNTFLREIKADGTMEDMKQRWVIRHEEKMPDIKVPKKADCHLVIGTTGCNLPFTYYIGTELAGYDIELAYRFAAWMGASMEFKIYDYEGIITAAQAGDIDCIFANLFKTPERQETLKFSEPTFHADVGVMVRNADAIAKEERGDFWTTIRESFEKTFLRENRWLLFLKGIGTTLLITVLSILFGTVLGFFVFMLCRNGNRAANTITRFFVWLVRGLPVVVLLMILYYLVFGGVGLNATVVSIIGFTLVFGANVFSSIKSGVATIDKGQLEAAYSLGYTNRRAFFRVIFPQVMPHFLPPYKALITELIKATAIVGYVAVQDLTKMADIVRARTFDAFFPLISIAIIYLILAALLTFLVGRIGKNSDPHRRKPETILKGVHTK